MVQILPVFYAWGDEFVDELKFVRGNLKSLTRLGDTCKGEVMCMEVIVEPFDLVTGLQEIAGVTDIWRERKFRARLAEVIGTETRTPGTVLAMTFVLERTFFTTAEGSVGAVERIRAVVEVAPAFSFYEDLDMVSSHLPRDGCGMNSEKGRDFSE